MGLLDFFASFVLGLFYNITLTLPEGDRNTEQFTHSDEIISIVTLHTHKTLLPLILIKIEFHCENVIL